MRKDTKKLKTRILAYDKPSTNMTLNQNKLYDILSPHTAGKKTNQKTCTHSDQKIRLIN